MLSSPPIKAVDEEHSLAWTKPPDNHRIRCRRCPGRRPFVVWVERTPGRQRRLPRPRPPDLTRRPLRHHPVARHRPPRSHQVRPPPPLPGRRPVPQLSSPPATTSTRRGLSPTTCLPSPPRPRGRFRGRCPSSSRTVSNPRCSRSPRRPGPQPGARPSHSSRARAPHTPPPRSPPEHCSSRDARATSAMRFLRLSVPSARLVAEGEAEGGEGGRREGRGARRLEARSRQRRRNEGWLGVFRPYFRRKKARNDVHWTVPSLSTTWRRARSMPDGYTTASMR